MQRRRAGAVCTQHFRRIGERHAFAFRIHAIARHVVETEHDVLRRHDDRLAGRRRQNVVRRHHQRARFELRFQRQRHVHGHLVAVEVGVVRGADQRVQLNRFTFDQRRFERLNAEPVQRRRAVQQHGVFANDFGQDVPDFRRLAFHHLLRGLDRRRETARFELAEDERLEQFERHLLRQTALVQLQRRTYHDHRATGVVDALAEQVLTEPTLLAFDHVGERLQRTLVRAGDRTTATTVVEQRIDRFLQHALLVAHDDVGRIEVEQPLQAVVAVDDAAIQIVQIRRREAAAVERYQRTQVRRQHRQHGHDHPLGVVARVDERFHQLQALRQLLDLRLGVRRRNFFAQTRDLFVDVLRFQQRLNRFGTHLRDEFIAVLFELRVVLLIGQQLTDIEVGHARIDDDIRFEIQHALDVAQRHVEQQPDTRRQRLQEPDVRNRAREFDVAHAIAPHFRQRDFDAALLADHAAMLEALVLAAQTLVVLHRPEDAGAEQTVALRLERAVVDRLRLLHFAERPRPDHVRRRETDAQRVEFVDSSLRFEKIQ